MRILIAEDDEALAKFIRQGLEGEHYSVDVVADGEQARNAAVEREYDIVVLDLNLPRLDGVSVLRQLRLKKPTLPVVVLTQRTKVEDRVQCLDTGADDYLPKPFSFSELSARIRALIRRSHLPSESVLKVGDLKLDRVQRLVERAGRKIELTGKEFSLLEYLMQNAGRDVTRSMIVEHVWNLAFDTTTNVVDVYINYLRRKIDDGYPVKLIHTARGGWLWRERSGRACRFGATSMSGAAAKLALEAPGSGSRREAFAHLLHALNQPLTGLQCSLELAAAQPRLVDEYAIKVREGLELVSRMRILVEALREIAEMHSPSEGNASDFLLDGLYFTAADELERVADAKRVHFRVRHTCLRGETGKCRGADCSRDGITHHSSARAGPTGRRIRGPKGV
jgi:two-component system copper resistance phosphate regulon response regulator CusR